MTQRRVVKICGTCLANQNLNPYLCDDCGGCSCMGRMCRCFPSEVPAEWLIPEGEQEGYDADELGIDPEDE